MRLPFPVIQDVRCRTRAERLQAGDARIFRASTQRNRASSTWAACSSIVGSLDAHARRHRCVCDAFLQEFHVGGQAAVPVSLLLEYAIALGVEIVPDNWPVLHLTEMRNASFDLQALGGGDGTFVFERDAIGRWHSDRWLVDVTFSAPRARPVRARRARVRARGAAATASRACRTLYDRPLSIEDACGLAWTHSFSNPVRGGVRQVARSSLRCARTTTPIYGQCPMPRAQLCRSL